MEEEKKQETNVIDKAKEEVEKLIKQVTESGLQVANVELLYKLIDIHKDINNEEYWEKKEENMMYRDYDNYSGGRSRDSRGRYMDSYGRYTTSRKENYRGREMINDIDDNYGRYNEAKTYGDRGSSTKSLEYMLESIVCFVEMLQEDATNQDEMDLIRKYTRKISEM